MSDEKQQPPKAPAAKHEQTPLLLQTTSDKAPVRSVFLSVCSFILAAEFCLCLAYAAFTGSLPIFFRKSLGVSSVLATELNNVLRSLFNLTPILGAYIADTHLGRFQTIAVFGIVYLVGLVLCTLSSLPSISSMPLFMIGLYGGVAFGAGGIKPNVVVLGADQFDLSIPSQRDEKASFFNWFYWSINIGSFISYALLSNLSVNGYPPYIPEEYGFIAAFVFATVIFAVGLGVFYSGKPRYRRLPPQGSALHAFTAVLRQAGGRTRQGKLVLSGALAFIPGIVLTTVSYFISDQSTWHMGLALAGAGCVLYGILVLISSGKSTDWLQSASVANGGSHTPREVKDVRLVLRLMPYLSILIMFWAVYSQMQSNFLLQGCQMDLRLNTNTDAPTLLSSSMLSILNSGAILVFIPLFDRLFYPLVQTLGIRLTLLRKIGAGLFFAALAMGSAGLVEQTRKRRPQVPGIGSNCASVGEFLPMSEISVWWQSLQYLLIGISEILTSITSYDLFYTEVPESMRSVCQSLNLLSITLGYIVSGALNSIFSFWVTSDLNQGHLEYIYYLLSLLILVNLGAFVHVSRSFQYHVPPSDVDSASRLVTGFSPAVARATRSILGRFRPLRRQQSTPSATAA
ncbi:hypothetical protein Poli38472_004705 [Pythium oligandrum]|uniref:Uncharacterized protein n=1 Tax=Pythium oligandrum TaxID=41045 RepID=A0A8K1CAZ1_PYTOL|nr:hypothetical protein Poli38472_004705 [Pythium oligandrum]|eukprot:TMW59636.1 hypothetical protein Poli38472_004705 [Pythium oligandrum]